MMANTIVCEKCGEKESTILKKNEVITVRGEDIEVESTIRVCLCGNELLDMALEEENLEQAYDEYRKRHSYMSPKDIGEIRERYGLSQRTLGKVLGWGAITIHRYETGAIPNEAHHRLLKLLQNPEIMKDFLVEAKNLIPSSTYKKAMAKIESIIEEKEEDSFVYLLQRKLEYSFINIESGFKQIDFQKVLNTVLYFAQNVNDLWKTKLNKLLFYTDFSFFKDFTISVTGLKYIKLDYGPVPQDFEGLLWHLEKLGYITLNPSQVYVHSGDIIQPLAEFDPDIFTAEEMAVLEQVKQRYGHYNASEISEFSHEEKGWIETPYREIISYVYANELK
ncbi:MAG: type II TA system antitoxin MqsA family protein [Carboxydocellales bacterium]